MDVFDLKRGNSPLLISMPHSGIELSEGLVDKLTPAGQSLVDTDWHIPQLYSFLDQFDVSVIKANYSRYVIDLNRPAGGGGLYPGQRETEICPTTTFMDQAIYRQGEEPTDAEIAERTNLFWQPYHEGIKQELERIKSQHGYALIWDAHSIQSQLPRFFEGSLPNLNMGTADGTSCDAALSAQLSSILHESDYITICNGRFKGGYITRNYGSPKNSVHAVQMEISQTSYMSEYPEFEYLPARADKLKPVLEQLIQTMRAYPHA